MKFGKKLAIIPLTNQMGVSEMTDDRPEIELRMDPEVRVVAEFMVRSIPAAKLSAVGCALGQLAPLLWGPAGEIEALRLQYALRDSCAGQTLPAATESARA